MQESRYIVKKRTESSAAVMYNIAERSYPEHTVGTVLVEYRGGVVSYYNHEADEVPAVPEWLATVNDWHDANPGVQKIYA